jgi:hypothetical protein
VTDLNEGEWELDGQALQDAYTSVVNDSGLDDSAESEIDAADFEGDGMLATRVRLTQRPVTIELDFETDSASARKTRIDAIRAAMAPSADRRTPKVLRFRRQGEVTKRSYVLPASGTPIEIAGDEANIVYNRPTAKLHLVAFDPVIYSDATTATSYTVTGGVAVGHSVTNSGTLPANSAGAWSATITAATGGCSYPTITGTGGEMVQALAILDAGDVLTIDTDRSCRINGVLFSKLRGSNGAPVAGWPILRPGTQTITFSGSLGDYTATFTHRSTW